MSTSNPVDIVNQLVKAVNHDGKIQAYVLIPFKYPVQ